VTNSNAITCLNAALEGRYRVERELGRVGSVRGFLARSIGTLLLILKDVIHDIFGDHLMSHCVRMTVVRGELVPCRRLHNDRQNLAHQVNADASLS